MKLSPRRILWMLIIPVVIVLLVIAVRGN